MRRWSSEKRWALAALFLLLFFGKAGAQRVVFSECVDTTREIPAFGPNRAFYAHGLLQAGVFSAPFEYGMETNWWSGGLTYGVRMKWKLWSWNALVFDCSYRYDNYSIRKKQSSIAPFFPGSHQRTRLAVQNLSFSLCDRINFDRRGNVMGEWIDLGVYGDWAFRTTNVYVDQHYDSNSPSGYRFKSKTRITRLPYAEPFNYGLTVHLGGDVVGLFANYRLNDFITNTSSSTHYHDLPRLMIGIELYSTGQQ